MSKLRDHKTRSESIEREWPEPIPDTPESVADALLNVSAEEVQAVLDAEKNADESTPTT